MKQATWNEAVCFIIMDESWEEPVPFCNFSADYVV